MRKAALFASGAQLLNAIYAIAPELFGIGRAPVSGQLLDQAFRWFIFVESFTLAVFFFLVFRSAALNIAGSAVRIASLVAASTLIIENMLPTLGTIQGAIAAANNSLGWKYHPLNQFAYVLGPTIPTLENYLSGSVSFAGFFTLIESTRSGPKAEGFWGLELGLVRGGDDELHCRSGVLVLHHHGGPANRNLGIPPSSSVCYARVASQFLFRFRCESTPWKVIGLAVRRSASRSGLLCAEAGQGLPPFPAPLCPLAAFFLRCAPDSFS
jgi:hypothetical protein